MDPLQNLQKLTAGTVVEHWFRGFTIGTITRLHLQEIQEDLPNILNWNPEIREKLEGEYFQQQMRELWIQIS